MLRNHTIYPLICLTAYLTGLPSVAAQLTQEPLPLVLARHTPHHLTMPLFNTDTTPLITANAILRTSSTTVSATLQATTCPPILQPKAQCDLTFSLLSTYPHESTPVELSLQLNKKVYARQATLLSTTPYLTTVLVNSQKTPDLLVKNQTHTPQPLSTTNTLLPLATQVANPDRLLWVAPDTYHPPVSILKNSQEQIIGYSPNPTDPLVSFNNASLTVSLPPAGKNTVYDTAPLLPYFATKISFPKSTESSASPRLTLSALPSWTAQQTQTLHKPPTFAQEVRSITVALYITTTTRKNSTSSTRHVLSLTPLSPSSQLLQPLIFDTSHLYALPVNASWSLFPDSFLTPSQILCKTHLTTIPTPPLLSAQLTTCQPDSDQTAATLQFRQTATLTYLRTSNISVETPTHAHTPSSSACQFTTLSTTNDSCTLQWTSTTYPQYLSLPLSSSTSTKNFNQTLRLKIPAY